MSMRWQLFAAFGLIILIALGTVAVVAQYAAEREVETFLRHGGQEGLENLTEALENFYEQEGSWSGVESIFPTAGAGRGRIRGSGASIQQGDHTLANSDGVVIIDTREGALGETLSADEIHSAIPLIVSGETVGYLLPENGIVQYPQNFEPLLIERINRATLLAALISGVLAVLLAAVFAGIIQKPVRDLTRAVNKLSQGDLSQRVHVPGRGELGLLAENFNDMARSLQDAASRRKAMTADIAHELRNPLAVQRAQLEALQDGVFPLNQEQLNRLYAQNQTLSRLVEDLRLLALADAGELTLNKAKIALAPLCLETLANFTPQISGKEIELETDFEQDTFIVYADKERIQQIINNLMQNALRYTPEGGRIKVSLRKEKEDAALAVTNSGPLMSDETLEHLFERFYRGDRGRDRAGGGTGLGLSIAKKLAEAHHGSLTGKNHPEGGVIFTLTLPILRSN